MGQWVVRETITDRVKFKASESDAMLADILVLETSSHSSALNVALRLYEACWNTLAASGARAILFVPSKMLIDRVRSGDVVYAQYDWDAYCGDFVIDIYSSSLMERVGIHVRYVED